MNMSKLLRMWQRLIRLGGMILLLYVPLATSCNQSQLDFVPPFRSIKLLTTAKENGVEVSIELQEDLQNHIILAATFSPTEPGYHLYSKDLPMGGIDGVGRPTLVGFSSDFENIDKIQASVQSEDLLIEGFCKPFPVYPTGAVTLRLPLSFPSEKLEQQSLDHVYVNYMACSDSGTCLAPVVKKKITIEIP